MKSLINFLIKHCVYGRVRCWMYSVEWQKRGLPHAHILLWLVDKIRPDEIDSIISAEIPDETVDPKLHAVTHDTWTLRTFQLQFTLYGRRQVFQAIPKRPAC